MNEEGRAYEEFTIPLDAPVGQYLIRACSIERCVEDWRFSVVPGSAVNNTQFTKFTNLRFSNSRDGIFQPLFSAGTQEIYAVWDYEGMKEGDKITRRWYLNDKEPRTVEEDWNFSKYGSSGTVGDVYLYDYTDGLESGEWRVDLYLNDELQISGKFTIGE